MTDPNAKRDFGGVVVLAGFGAIFVTLITLIAFQPQIGAWIVASTEAEMAYQASDQHPQTIIVTELKRRPIGPGHWAEIVPTKLPDTRSR
jgi:hypothetical protein